MTDPTNDYYDRTEDLARNTGARPDQISRELDGVVAGFQKLPGQAALNSGAVTYFEEVGTSQNAYVVEVENGPTTPTKGTAVSFYAGSANTGPATLKYGSWDQKALRRLDGTELISGDIKAGQLVEARFKESYWTISAIIVAELQNAIDAAAQLTPYLDEIQAVGGISTELIEVHSNLAAITGIHTNMTDIQTVAANIPTIVQAAEIYAENNDVSSQILFMELAL